MAEQLCVRCYDPVTAENGDPFNCRQLPTCPTLRRPLGFTTIASPTTLDPSRSGTFLRANWQLRAFARKFPSALTVFPSTAAASSAPAAPTSSYRAGPQRSSARALSQPPYRSIRGTLQHPNWAGHDMTADPRTSAARDAPEMAEKPIRHAASHAPPLRCAVPPRGRDRAAEGEAKGRRARGPARWGAVRMSPLTWSLRSGGTPAWKGGAGRCARSGATCFCGCG